MFMEMMDKFDSICCSLRESYSASDNGWTRMYL